MLIAATLLGIDCGYSMDGTSSKLSKSGKAVLLDQGPASAKPCWFLGGPSHRVQSEL